MLQALLLISRHIAFAHDRWRATVSRKRPLSGRISILEERIARLEVENTLLRTRLLRMPARRRPRYRPWERLDILWHQGRHGLSALATARTFGVSKQTVLNWHRVAARKKQRLLQGRPPVNRLPDLVTELARRLKAEWPRWGTRRIAGILARMGVTASRTSVQRILRAGPRRPVRETPVLAATGRALLAKRPNHIWLIDFTRVGGRFRSVRVGAVIDAFSRKILAIAVAPREPTAAFALRLLRQAIATAGAPTWIVTDHGRQFTSRAFTRALTRRRIRRRYGAVGKMGSIALIERFWRSMKEEYARGLVLYRPLRSIERALGRYATWFNLERPHAGVGLRAPGEVHAGALERQTRSLTRGTLAVAFIDGDAHLPVLRLRRAA